MDETTRAEHDQWTALCAALLLTGAVRQSDLDAPTTADATPGQRLLTHVRAWGAARARLMIDRLDAVRERRE